MCYWQQNRLCVKLFIAVALLCRLSVQENHLKPYNGLDGLYEEPTTWTVSRQKFLLVDDALEYRYLEFDKVLFKDISE